MLLGRWAYTGRTVAEFWTLTPRQIDVVFKGETDRLKAETTLNVNLAAYQVWRLAGMMRLKRLPAKPDDLMKKKRASTGPDWRAQKAALELFNAGIGGYDNRKKGG